MIKRLLLGMLLASAPSLMAQSAKGHGGGSGTALNVQSLAADPGTCTNSQIWYNTSSNTYKICPNGAVTAIAAGGSVTTFSSGNLAPLFTTSVATGSTTPAQTFSLTAAAANLVFGNCTTGSTAGSYCSLTAAMEPSTTVNSFVNDTNVTASITAQAATFAWSGTLAAARLNANVVQGFTNDTNVTATITSQNATLGWTGTLAKARIISTAVYNDQSNTFSTGTQDFSAVTVFRPKFGTVASLPGTCTVGDIYEATNATAGQNWYFCTATNTWTQQLNTGGSAGAWSAITNPSGNLALSMAGNTSIFSTTTALSELFGWENTTAAVVGTSQGSPIPLVCGTGFHSSASVKVCAGWGLLPGNGNDAAITVNHLVTTTSTGPITDQFSGGLASGSDGVHAAIVSLLGNTTAPALPSNTFSFLGPNSASFTAFSWQPPTAENGSAGIAHLGAASSHISALTVSQIVAADITNATITGTQIASSVALAGSPTTTTQTAKDNSTKIATTAYVDATTGLTAGTSVTLAAPRQYFVCTGACTITVPVPAAGDEFCVMNDDNIATVITLSAIGSSARYENTARTAYGTAGTGTFVSSGAAGDKVCLLGRDATHYLTASFNGTWTAN